MNDAGAASAFQQLLHQSPPGADAVFRRAQDQLFPVRYARFLAGGGETANATRDGGQFRLAAQECGQRRARRQHGPGQREAGLDVVADDRGITRTRISAIDDDNRHFGVLREQPAIVGRAARSDDQPVDAARPQATDGPVFEFRILVGRRGQQNQAAAAAKLLKARHQAGKERVAQLRHHQPDRIRAPELEAAGGVIDHEAVAPDLLLDDLRRRLADFGTCRPGRWRSTGRSSPRNPSRERFLQQSSAPVVPCNAAFEKPMSSIV